MDDDLSIRIMGVEFYPITLQGALNAFDWMLECDDGCTRLVVTANPIMVMDAGKDPELLHILENAHLVLPDGVGILWAAKEKGWELPARVTGVDFAHAVLKKEPSPRVFFLGGKPGVCDKAAKNVSRSIPGAKICGTRHGYFRPGDEEQVVRQIARTRPDVIFCGMGSPRQEKFLWKYRNALGAKVGIGLGGVLDVLAGTRKRAPLYMQKAGLEWFYRLLTEPSRLKRDWLLLEFAAKVKFQSYLQRRHLKGESHNGPDVKQGKPDTRYKTRGSGDKG